MTYLSYVMLSNFYKERPKPLGLEESYTEEELIAAVIHNLDLAKPGYRDGVILVPIDPKCIRTSVVKMEPGMKFKTTYEPRVSGEPPRKKTVALVDELPLAKAVSVVLYHAEVLEEDGDRSTPGEWEIITVLAHAGEESEPMNPGTLMANHFHDIGHTATNMTSQEFEKALRESFNFWKGHCLAELN